MRQKIKSGENLDLAIEHIERDHGECDSNTCTIGVALRHGFYLVAIDSWAGSGAAAPDFPNRLGYSRKELQAESKLMCDTIPHVVCPHCNAALWEPEDCGYFCDSCAKRIPQLGLEVSNG